MTFKNARLKLTIWYVLIVMLISVTFSAVVYLISFHEVQILNQNQANILRTRNLDSNMFPPNFSIKDFDDFRTQQLEQLKYDMIRNLFLTNFAIIILAGLASYSFARRTLRPIEEMVTKQNNFTADASHELRTPLAAMKLETEVALRDKKINLADAKNLLKSNLEEIDKLENLANSLLALAQYEISKKVIETKKFNLKEAINIATLQIKPLAQNKSIIIKSNVDEQIIGADKNQFVQVLNILLDNAVKYSPDKSSVELRSVVKNKQISVSVIDHGIGIKASDLPYIYNRFYRADQSRSKEEYTGYGLGLSIAKQIVEKNNWEISVESNPNHGTAFTVKLLVS